MTSIDAKMAPRLNLVWMGKNVPLGEKKKAVFK